MDDHLIGLLAPHQGAPLMARLSAGFLATLLAQTLGLSHEAIRAGRQAAIAAVFRQPVFQRCDVLYELLNLLFPLSKLLTQVSIFVFQLVQSFFWAHASTLLLRQGSWQVCRRPE